MESRPFPFNGAGSSAAYTQPGGGWSAVRGALQLADLLQKGTLRLEAGKHETSGLYNTQRKWCVPTIGRQGFLPSCAPCFSASPGAPREACLDYYTHENGELLSSATVSWSPGLRSDRIPCSFGYPIRGSLRRTSRTGVPDGLRR